MKQLIMALLMFGLLTACATTKQQQPSTSPEATQGPSGLSGKVTLKNNGQALEGAYVNVYPSHAFNLLGPATYLSSPTGADGSYSIDVPPGAYYVVARKRTSGLASGPLSPGDHLSEDSRKLVEIKAGMRSRVDLPMVKMTAPMFFKQGGGIKVTERGISGILVNAESKPVTGGFAIAYRNSDIQRLPDFVSTVTNDKGEFTLYLPAGGTYYLAARLHGWDMPRPGEPYGKYDGDELKAVRVPGKGFVEGIRINMLPFTGTYKEGMNKRPY